MHIRGGYTGARAKAGQGDLTGMQDRAQDAKHYAGAARSGGHVEKTIGPHPTRRPP